MCDVNKKIKMICLFICVLLFGGLCGCGIPHIGRVLFMNGNDKSTLETKGLFQKSSDGSEKCIEEFIRALDEHDKETIRDCFCEYVRKNDNELDQEIEALFAAYDGPTDSWRWDGSSTESYSTAPEENREYITCTAVLKSKGKNYYLYVEYTTIDMGNKGRDGLCCADFTTPEVQAAISDGRRELTSYKGENMWKGEDRYKLHVTTDHKGGYQTRRIEGRETIYTPTDTMVSSTDFVNFAKTNRSLKDLRGKFGPENSNQKYLQTINYKVTDGDDLYVCIYVDGIEGQEITMIDLVNEEKDIKTIFIKE
jgi:hypothetical protein